MSTLPLSTLETRQLSISYVDVGPADGWPVVLSHGFPYDIHAYKDCLPALEAAGARVIVPFLRGYGSTRFLRDSTPRSGEQAALANDLKELMDALSIPKAVLAGYDWGGRASCIVAALWPERVSALVSGNSYNIQNIARSMEPASAAEEASFWYQYYFHSERGQRGLQQNRRELARQLWTMWSPTWAFCEATFDRSASAFDNADFVAVVIHSYRHRFGLVAGDPDVADIESRLALQPGISVPTVTIDGEVDGVDGSTAHHRHKFVGPHEHRVFPDTGHNLPQERPMEWVDAILQARRMTTDS